MMKRLLLFFLAGLTIVTVQAQNTKSQIPNSKLLDSLIHEVYELRQDIKKADSLNKLYMDGIYNNVDKPRYKIYQTENTYNLLKLDTRRGKVWQVQYRMKDVEAMVVDINYWGVVFESDGWDGRFELYPTKNMYTFIMLDTGTGDTYQVQ